MTTFNIGNWANLTPDVMTSIFLYGQTTPPKEIFDRVTTHGPDTLILDKNSFNSTAIRAPNETKSTMQRPIGACSRKWKPSAFSSRNLTHSFISCGVSRLRSARAFSFGKSSP